jgi:putative transcriptional regulator
MAKSRILQEMHETARGLYAAGVYSEKTMRDFDKACLSPVHALAPDDIRKLRKRVHASQAVFAACINASVSTVQKWERGEKQPTGVALKMLNLIEQKGLEAVV